MSTSNVSFTRSEVAAQLGKWKLIRDCLLGQDAIKAAGTTYLPMPNSTDNSNENKARYAAYKERAVFYNVSRRTRDGLVGQVFVRDPVVEVSDTLKTPFLSDVDGSGVGLFAHSRKTLADTLSFGRCGLLVDYPETEKAATVAELQTGFIRPTIVQYQPEQIVNWRTTTVGARKLLSLVVLVEEYEAADDGFEQTMATQWRVLRLVDRVYTVEIWQETKGEKETTTSLTKTFTPRDSSGKPFSEIPFTFVGAVNNDADVDPAPLYDLAVLNIAHYRNSADYEESCFLVGQPTLFAAGLSESWVANVLKGGIQMGSRALLPLPDGGNAGLLQVNPNSMPAEAMDKKERQMVALGARLVEQRSVQRTASEAQMEEAGETSMLSSVTKNVADAYTHALEWCRQFAGTGGDVSYVLNTDFAAAHLTPDERAELVAEWQAGAIGYSEMRAQFRRAGVATLKDEEAKDEAEADTLRTGPKLGNPGNSVTGGTNNGRMTPRQSGKVTTSPKA